MTPDVDEREIANFALTIGTVATVLLVALLVAGTEYVAGVGVALFLSISLAVTGTLIHPRLGNNVDDVEEFAQGAIAFGSFTIVLSILIGATAGGPWDVIAVILFLAGVMLAVGGSLLGIRATGGRNGGASA